MDTQTTNTIIPEIVDTDYNQAGISDISERSLVKIYEGAIANSTELSLKTQRLFRVIVSLVKPSDRINKVYAFNVADYQKIFGMTDYPKKQLLDASEELTKAQLIPYQDNPNNFTRTGLVTFFDVKDGVVTFGIAPRLLPYYKLVKEKQQYMIGNTRKFESSYSFAFYELFVVRMAEASQGEIKNAVSFYMTLNDLRSWLKLKDNYVNKNTGIFSYGSFNARVLKPVYKDINRIVDGSPICNLNFEYEVTKSGRSVVGLTFNVCRVHLENIEEPLLNPFYDKLAPDVKLGYDALLALNIKKAEIEKCILIYGDERFIKVVKYIQSKRYKGGSYISACVRNGWVDNNDHGCENFSNIAKAYNLQAAEIEHLEKIEAFVAVQSDEKKNIIYTAVLKDLQQEPQIYKHVSKLKINDILATKDIKVFFIEKLQDIILNQPESPISKWFGDFTPCNAEASGDRKNVIDRFKQYGINHNIWQDLLGYSDERILANIAYCEENYSKKQKDIAGVIITAIKKDYAQYEVKTKEAQLAAEKHEKQEAMREAMSRMTGVRLVEFADKQDEEADIAKVEIAKRANEERVRAEEDMELAFEKFLNDSDEIEKEKVRDAVIAKGGFIPALLKNKLRVSELSAIPLKTLLEIQPFRLSFKTCWKELYYGK